MAGKNFCKKEWKWCKHLKHNGTCLKAGVQLCDVTKCPRIAAIETVTFSEVINSTNLEDVLATLFKFCPDQEKNKDGYEKVFDKLRSMTPKRNNLSDPFICIDKVFEEDGGWWPDVYGLRINSNKRLGMEFVRWRDWVTMFINKDTLTNFSKKEIVAACLYEMTFFGFAEDDIQGEHDKLLKSVEEAMKLSNKK